MAGSLADVIRQRLGECSPAERKVARALLAAYPTAGLETVVRLAERAGVSAPTVIRFANRFGFRGFPELQQALRDELEAREASPLTLYGAAAEQADSDEAGLLRHGARIFGAAIDMTLTSLPPEDLRAAIALLADRGRRIWTSGGRFSHLLAQYLSLHLAQLRERSAMLPDLAVERAAALSNIGRRDVFVIFDYRRYEPPTLELARFVHDRGARIVLFTDIWLSPVAHLADVVLPCRLDTPSPYDSIVPSLAMVETVVAGVLTQLGESAHERMLACEDAAKGASIY